LDLYIYGCGGRARAVGDTILNNNNNNISLIFVDKNAKEGEKIFGFPSIDSIDDMGKINFYAIGDNYKRKQFFEMNNFNIINVISNLSYIGTNVQINKGTFIGNYCNVGAEVKIGFNCIINTGCIIEHQSIIGDYCHIAVNSTICGKVLVGECVFVGAGATIIDNIKICSNVVIGAGATVIEDITVEGVYVGTPARRIK
jgi:sugar O-acyltransferase (sialic acid O-acetyltransferase NeuD family)